MWQHLEKHKQRYGLALLALALLWLAANYAKNREIILELPSIFIFVGLAMLGAFIYVSGAAGLVQGLATLVIAAFCLLIALAGDLAVLRAFAVSNDFTYTIAVILFLLLAFWLQIPKRIREKATRYFTADTETATQSVSWHQDEENSNAAAVSPNFYKAETTKEADVLTSAEKLAAALENWEERAALPESETVPYQRVTHYRQAFKDVLRSWSLKNNKPFMTWLRVGLAVLLTGSGLFLIINGIQQRLTNTDFFRSAAFTLIFAGALTILYALGLLILGLLRGLILPAAGAVIFYCFLGVVRITQALAAWPFLLRLLVIAVFLALYSLIFYYMLRSFGRRYDLFNWIYHKDRLIIGVDIALKDMLPLEDYTICIETAIKLDTALSAERRHQKAIDITAWYQHRLNLRKIQPAGFVFDQETGNLTFYAYCKPKDLSKSLIFCRQILEQQGLAATIKHQNDPYWSAYQDQLFPNPTILMDIINIRQLELLDYEGVDLQVEHPVRIALRFTAAGHREAGCQRLQDVGLKVVSEPIIGVRERWEFENENEYYLAFVEVTALLTRQRLNALTGMIYELVKPLGGELLAWGITPANDYS
ncbi:MAG: DUF695 domain-containing protein [Saccharofermentanales bacterium]